MYGEKVQGIKSCVNFFFSIPEPTYLHFFLLLGSTPLSFRFKSFDQFFDLGTLYSGWKTHLVQTKNRKLKTA